MINYSVEKVVDLIPELLPFVKPHWEELGLDHQDVPVDMNWDKYIELENMGMLHIVTVRDDKTLIGYIFHMITPMLHYKSTLHGVADLYYVKPEYRKGRNGVKLFQFAEAKLKELGVVKIITGTKLHLPHNKLFEALGYKATETIFTKIINEEK